MEVGIALAQWSLSISLNYGSLALFVPSCWLGCLGFTLVRPTAVLTCVGLCGRLVGRGLHRGADILMTPLSNIYQPSLASQHLK